MVEGIAARRRRFVTPVSAAWLSLLVPGLGQLAAGRFRRGLIVALPTLALLAAAIGLATRAPSDILDLLLQREVVIGLFVVNAVLLVYRLFAITDAYRIVRAVRPATGRLRRLARAVALILALAITVAAHGAIGYVGYRGAAALTEVFAPSELGGGELIPEPGFDDPEASPSAEPSPSPTPTPSPSPTPRSPNPTLVASALPTPPPSPSPSPSPKPKPPWAKDGRLSVLLVGSDAGPDRWSLRTDTMIVLSVEVATRRAALFGIPRNLVGVPLAPESAGAVPGGRFPGLLNALYVYAMGHPDDFPGGETRGLRAVAGAVQELVGQRLDGMIVVNLAGFVRLVDAIGGLWIDVPERLVDLEYPLSDGTLTQLVIEAGCQRLKGERALAYARSRHQDSDYGRMQRQQLVIVSLRRQLDPMTVLPRLPELLDVAGDSLWTTFRPSAIRQLARLADRVPPRQVAGFLFVPPRYPSRLTDDTIARIRSVVRRAFDGPAQVYPEWGVGPCP